MVAQIRKFISDILFDLSILLILLVVLIIGKGAYDLITSGHLYFWRYATSLIHEMFGAIIFFSLIELIDFAWKRRKKN